MLTIEQLDHLSHTVENLDEGSMAVQLDVLADLIAAARRDADVRTLDEWAAQPESEQFHSHEWCCTKGQCLLVATTNSPRGEKQLCMDYDGADNAEARHAAASAVRKETER